MAPQAQRAVQEHLARSSVPVQDLEGISGFHVQYPHPQMSGQYFPSTRHINLHPDPLHGLRDQKLGMTLVHEVGHHANPPFTVDDKYLDADEQGYGEAVAENYADEHYRHDPRSGGHPISEYDTLRHLDDRNDVERGWHGTYDRFRNPVHLRPAPTQMSIQFLNAADAKSANFQNMIPFHTAS